MRIFRHTHISVNFSFLSFAQDSPLLYLAFLLPPPPQIFLAQIKPHKHVCSEKEGFMGVVSLLTCHTPTMALSMRIVRMTNGSTKAVIIPSSSSNHAKICNKECEKKRGVHCEYAATIKALKCKMLDAESPYMYICINIHWYCKCPLR